MNPIDNKSSYVCKLTEYMVNDILTEESSIQKVIGIYSGRFQPAGLHHYKTYKWFEKQFDEAWVATSDKTNSIDSPLDYNAKKLIWAKHGVRNISKVKNPYKAEEILKRHDEKTTSAVFLVGKKDADRLSKEAAELRRQAEELVPTKKKAANKKTASSV